MLLEGSTPLAAWAVAVLVVMAASAAGLVAAASSDGSGKSLQFIGLLESQNPAAALSL